MHNYAIVRVLEGLFLLYISFLHNFTENIFGENDEEIPNWNWMLKGRM